MKSITNLLLLLIVVGCSVLQNSDTEGEYRYVPITDALKKLSYKDFASRLRTASLTCEKDIYHNYRGRWSKNV